MLRFNPAILVVCLLPLALAGCRDNSPKDDPRTQPPLVRVTKVISATDGSRAFSGVVVARVQSDLGFRVSGKILERLVDSGQRVKRGQPLMRLDPADLRLQAQAQQQTVAAAQARVRQASADQARYRTLVATGAVSASAYDQIRAAAATAQAELKAAQAQASVARNASGYALLLADDDGVVMATLAEPGQVVSAGEAVIKLARAGQREASVQLPETLRPAVGSEAKASLYGAGSTPVSARLRQLADVADPMTRTFEARYVLEGALASAPLGATVTITLPNKPSQPLLQVPLAAIYDAGKGPGVWDITGQPATVAWRPVTVVSISDEAATVTGQLNAGDQVVALGAHLLQQGERVRPDDAAVAGSQP